MRTKNRQVKQILKRGGSLILAAFFLLLISCSSVEKELERLNSADSEKRRNAAVCLARRLRKSDDPESPQHKKMVRALARTATGDSNYYVRASSLSALVEDAPGDSLEAISTCLKDSSPLVREEAVKAAAKVKANFLAPSIVKILLEDEEVSVRRSCPPVLASFLLDSCSPPLSEEATREILEALCNALQDKEDSVRFAAKESLACLLGTDAGESIEKWKRLLEERKEGK